MLPGLRAVLDFPFEPLTPWIDHLYALGYPEQKRAHDIFRADRSFPGAADHGADLGPADLRGRAQRDRVPDRRAAGLARRSGTATSRGSRRRDPAQPVVRPPQLPAAPPALPGGRPYHDRYDPAEVPVPGAGRRPARPRRRQHRLAELAVGVVGAPDDEAEMRQIRATYYGMMTEVDDHLGRVLDWLDAPGQADDTLVVLTSDHGDQIGDHWLMEKLGYWDESYHVPMIVRDPRARRRRSRSAHRRLHRARRRDAHDPRVAGRSRSRPSATAARCAVPGRRRRAATAGAPRCTGSGTSAARPPTWPRTCSASPWSECTLDVIRDRRWKYVHMAGLAPLLFDLEADPDQFVDRPTDPACAPVVAEYAQKLLSWRLRHADRTLAGTLLTHAGPVSRVDPRVG